MNEGDTVTMGIWMMQLRLSTQQWTERSEINTLSLMGDCWVENSALAMKNMYDALRTMLAGLHASITGICGTDPHSH